MRRPLASLRSRVFAASVLAAILPIAAALGFVAVRLTQQAETDLGRGLREAARLVEQFHRARLETTVERARLVADLPRLKAAVATFDPPTIEPVAREYQEQVKSDVFVVSGRDRRVLVALGASAVSWPGGEASSGVGTQVEGDRLLETVRLPLVLGAEAPEILGSVTLGFALDDATAERLQGLTGCHVAVVHRGRVHASTLDRRHDRALVASAVSDGIVALGLAGEDWVALRQGLGSDGGAPHVLVLRSRAEALRPLRTLRSAFVVAALAAIGVSVLLSWAVARSVTRPLAALTDAMKEVAATGDLTRRIGPGRPWDDEDARLVARTFDTLTESVARFQREAAIKDRLSALGRLSTVIAHEVRNPLMIIKGSLRALRREGAAPEDVREATSDIDHEVARLDRIVGDALDFARPLRVERSPTNLASLLRDAAAAALEGRDGLVVRFSMDPAVGRISTDAERLRAAVLNLVANAGDGVVARAGEGAAPSGREPIEVGARRVSGARVLVWIADEGEGIAAADLAHVFEPYFTTKRTGTGLGLPIAQKIVEALGGSIRVESQPGRGTRVEIDLPDDGTLPPEAS